MSMLIPKTLLQIGMGGTQTEDGGKAVTLDLGDNFNWQEDLDNIVPTMSFDLPLIESNGFNTDGIQKYDLCRLFFKKFDNTRDALNATINDLDLVFDGYVDRIEINESKGNGVSYKIYAKTTMGLASERAMTTKSFEGNITTLFQHADGYEEDGVQYGIDLSSFLPEGKRVFDNFDENFILRITPDIFFTKVLESVKEKYAIQIYQTGNGVLYVKKPLYFNISVTIYEYDLNENVFNIDYGDITQKYDSVLVVGFGCYGFAFDPIAYQLKLGTKNSELSSSVDIDPRKLNLFKIYRRDVTNPEQAQEISKGKLVEFAKNNTITLTVDYLPEQIIGQGFKVLNSRKINPEQVWIIKNRDITISKNGGLQCVITGYSNAIIDFPEELLTPSTGLLDIDVLNSAKDTITLTQP